MENLFQMLKLGAEKYPERISHKVKRKSFIGEHTFSQTYRNVLKTAEGFSQFGIKQGDTVAFFTDNRYEWFLTDFGLITLGAVSVPRGSDTTPKELHFIYQHSDSRYLLVENIPLLNDLLPLFSKEEKKNCLRIFVIDRPSSDFNLDDEVKEKIVYFDQLMERGDSASASRLLELEQLGVERDPDDLVTIVYTSGTTGNPKGVMLVHRNLLFNVTSGTPRMELEEGVAYTTVSMLPSWHVYERAFEYVFYNSGVKLVYSNSRYFSRDLLDEKPELVITVPRIWESVYQQLIKTIGALPLFKRFVFYLTLRYNYRHLVGRNYLNGGYIRLHNRSRVRRVLSAIRHTILYYFYYPVHLFSIKLFAPMKSKLGGRFIKSSCGAGSLPRKMDEIFNALNITIINAYGMTECAPAILSRTPSMNTFGATGIPFPGVEVKLLNSEGESAKVGERGVLYARGPMVMKGYYKNPQATAEILKEDGWLCTGDLAVQSESGEYIIIGREKDTIVLAGGENVEPELVENKIKESVYIDHAVVLGQDRNSLSAIIALNEQELYKLAQDLKLELNPVELDGENCIENEKLIAVIKDEVNRLLTKENGFRQFEKIANFVLIKNSFKIGDELTQTLKVKRKFVENKYKRLVARLLIDVKKMKRKWGGRKK